MDKKFIYVSGGNVSGIGKGVCTASIAALLSEMGYSIGMIKFDGYLNIDAGTMRPEEHGEVYVLENGQETDLDLGTYYRFTGSTKCKYMNVTSGQIYKEILSRERSGSYLGETIQMVPHVTDLIKNKIIDFSNDVDIVLVEVGGVITDLEASIFFEALRQMPSKVGKNNCCYIHLTLVPFISSSGEIKTKPTQHSVRDLRSIGITPNILVCRTTDPDAITEEAKSKISMFCDIDPLDIIVGYDVKDVYDIPSSFDRQKIQERISFHLGLDCSQIKRPHKWTNCEKIISYDKKVKIGIVGKYTVCQDAYKSVDEALKHAARHHQCELEIIKIDSEKYDDHKSLPNINDDEFSDLNGVLVPGGFGGRGLEGKIFAAEWCMKTGMPFFGICYGMQAMVIAAARYYCGLEDADTTEKNKTTIHPVIDMMESQKTLFNMGGTMRLGNCDCEVKENTLAWRCLQESLGTDRIPNIIKERHRHRYEVNNKYLELLKNYGFIASGINPVSNLVEIFEFTKRKFCIGVQFHPEFTSRPFRPQFLFSGFVKAALEDSKSSYIGGQNVD